MKIILDAMGGDNAPKELLLGAAAAVKELGVEIIAVGDEEKIGACARENGIEMNCTVKDACETTGDPGKLQQVFYNVIDNAIKYTPRGGSVNIEVLRAGRRAEIRVSDTGVGIPEKDLPHIFERFYRVDKARSRETGGTGLGLSIVKQIVLLHNGTIEATSTVGQGTVFTIELPIG